MLRLLTLILRFDIFRVCLAPLELLEKLASPETE